MVTLACMSVFQSVKQKANKIFARNCVQECVLNIIYMNVKHSKERNVVIVEGRVKMNYLIKKFTVIRPS